MNSNTPNSTVPYLRANSSQSICFNRLITTIPKDAGLSPLTFTIGQGKIPLPGGLTVPVPVIIMLRPQHGQAVGQHGDDKYTDEGSLRRGLALTEHGGGEIDGVLGFCGSPRLGNSLYLLEQALEAVRRRAEESVRSCCGCPGRCSR